MKYKIPIIIWISVLCIIIAFRIEEKYDRSKKIDFATAEAESYISEKYGFEADSIEQNDDVFGTYFDGDEFSVSFKAIKDDKTFNIIFQNWKDKAVCYDDYQRKEIYAASEKYFCDNFPKGSVVSLYFHGKGIPYSGFMYKDAFFDGENISEILDKCSGFLEMVFYDTEFSQSDIEKVISKDRFIVQFASFDTKEHCEECLNAVNECKLYDFYKELEKYAPHLTDYIKTDKDDVCGYDITILENDEFQYAYFPVEPRNLVTRTDITAEPVEKSKVAEIFTRYGEENSLGKPISKEYYFDSIYGDVWVYYPLEKLDGYDIENIGLAWFSAGGMSNNHNIEKAEICGDYAVFNMPFGEDYFMLVETSSLKEYVPNYD